MADDDKVFKPSFYTATIVFTVTVLVIVIILAGILAAVPQTRGNMSVFVPVIAVGGAVIVVQAMRRIWAIEKSYVYTSTFKENSNSLLGCPDSYVTSGKGCAQATSTLSLDASLVSSSKAQNGVKVTHFPPMVELDMKAVQNADKGVFIGQTCSKAEYRAIPWATYKALCPVTEI
jgi:hypothetical protein